MNDFAPIMEVVALTLLGEPNARLSHPSRGELRFGSHGSLAVDLRKGTFYDHEAKVGGGVVALIRHKLGLSSDKASVQWLVDEGLIFAEEKPQPTLKPRIVATYDYLDDNGVLRFQVVRYEPKDFRQRRPGNNGEEWIWNLKGIARLPYRLPELLEAIARKDVVFIVEGEKGADRLTRLGLPATCNPGGANNWPDELTSYFRDAVAVILPDNDAVGREHAKLVAAKLKGTAASLRLLELPDLDEKGDVSDWLDAGHTIEELWQLVDSKAVEAAGEAVEPQPPPDDNIGSTKPSGSAQAKAKPKDEPPLPLTRELPPAIPFPVEALGDMLANTARAITDRVQVPIAIAAQSVLAAATLAAQGHANVELPTGERPKPLSSFFATIGESGERKSACDGEALWPIHKHEAKLRHEYDDAIIDYRNEKEAWDAARASAKKKGEGDKGDWHAIAKALEAIGAEPARPLDPLLVAEEPSYEGLCKLFMTGQPSLGLFASEGGAFLGGYAMDKDRVLRTATGLSELWDGKPIRRVRAAEGASVLPGRRLSAHLMLQPNIADILFGNELLAGQGLLSRFLTVWPPSAIGTRLQHPEAPETDPAIRRYGGRLLDILETPLPLAEGKLNELEPPPLRLSPEAIPKWKQFADHVEKRCAKGGALHAVRALANKLPEHAARLAAVLAVIDHTSTPSITAEQLQHGIDLSVFYVNEALRIDAAANVNGPLKLARELLGWLRQTRQPGDLVPLIDIYQRGPRAFRDPESARNAATSLEKYRWLKPVRGGAVINGIARREAWALQGET